MSQPSLHVSALQAAQSLSPASLPSRLLAAVLLRLSRQLARAARSVAVPRVRHRPPADEPVLEFHAEAGAPEGALYVDGHLVGHLSGVTRL